VKGIEVVQTMVFMTLEEVADYLRVTRKTIYRLLEKGFIPSLRVGHQWRFDKDSIDTWLNQNTNSKAARILVVDDDESICSLFTDIFAGSNHTVTTVNDSDTALKLLKDHDYDLIFLDLKIPGMDGAELFRQIRLTKPDLPVTIMTGFPDSDLMVKALAYGPLSVIKKPFRGADILSVMNNYLRFGRSLWMP
jgi:excisionase family DNA binding protein